MVESAGDDTIPCTTELLINYKEGRVKMKRMDLFGVEYEVVSTQTKKGQGLMWSAKREQGFELSDVYGRCSQAKRDIWEQWWAEYCEDVNAGNFHICSHNCNFFSIAWHTMIGGVTPATMLITPAHNYILVWDVNELFD